MPDEHPYESSRPDPTRRDILRNASHGLLAAGIGAGPLAAASGAGIVLAPPDKQPPELPIPQPLGRKLGYAVVGLGELALEEILPAFAVAEHSRPVALVSGHADKAKKVAERYGIAEKAIYNYQNYDSLRDNSEVDVIYIVLPNSMHAEYTIRGFAAGKHVLCEKPMAPTVADCQKMIDAGRTADRKLMIAYRLRYEPFNKKAIELCRSGEFGKLRVIEAENLQQTKAPNIRLSKETAGGAMGDVGIYCLNACRYLTGEEPIEVTAWTYSDPADDRFREVEGSVLFNLRFPSGTLAHCSASFGATQARRFRVFGDKGWIELDPAFSYTGQRLHTGMGADKTELHIEPVNHFAAEMDHFSECVMNKKDALTPGEEGLRDMAIIEKVFESARTRRTVSL